MQWTQQQSQQPRNTMAGFARLPFTRLPASRAGAMHPPTSICTLARHPMARVSPLREQSFEMLLAKIQRGITRQRAKRALQDSNFDLRNLYKALRCFMWVAAFPACRR